MIRTHLQSMKSIKNIDYITMAMAIIFILLIIGFIKMAWWGK